MVIAGLDPAIHLLRKKMDARVKPAHDAGEQRFNSSGIHCSVNLNALSPPSAHPHRYEMRHNNTARSTQTLCNRARLQERDSAA